MSGHCPSDKWFFGSVFMFLIAVGLLVGGAVNMQYSFFVSEQTRRWMLSFSRYEVTDYLV